MQPIDAIFEAIGILSSAYLLGYPLEFLIGRPVSWLYAKFTNASEALQQLNAELDLAYGEPLQFPWKRNKD